ncbi:MAG: pyridoxal phosphate-dependent aminotransferase [Planctomycetes bacterium]|nr:pyridoxal phosphate-dependent aminotransferase [Planctomycetota bacterium]
MPTHRLSQRVRALPASQTLALAARAKALKAEGQPIIDYSVGEPDFDTPAVALEGAREAIARGDTHYPPVPGTLALRKAVLADLERRFAWRGTPEQVLVSTGAKHTLYNLFQALLDPGDEVVFASPYWVSYPAMIELAGGRAIPVPTRAEDGFRIDPAAVEGAMGARTKILLLNSPSNPTGAVTPPEEVEALCRLAFDRGVFVVSDEIYRELVFDGAVHRGVLEVQHPRAAELALLVDGVSKAYAMTGWRIGWAVGPKDVLAAASKIQSQSTSGACTIAQAAAAAAVAGAGADTARMRDAFARRREQLVAALERIPGVKVPRAQGAFYAFPDLSAYYGSTIDGAAVTGSESLSEVLLEKAHVAAVAGAGFGADAHLRFSYALDDRLMLEGIERVAGVLARATPGVRA